MERSSSRATTSQSHNSAPPNLCTRIAAGVSVPDGSGRSNREREAGTSHCSRKTGPAVEPVGTSAAASALSRYLRLSVHLLGENGAEKLSEETSGAELLSSTLLLLESKRNLIRLAREGTLKPEHYQICVGRLEEDMQFFGTPFQPYPHHDLSTWPTFALRSGFTPATGSIAS